MQNKKYKKVQKAFSQHSNFYVACKKFKSPSSWKFLGYFSPRKCKVAKRKNLKQEARTNFKKWKKRDIKLETDKHSCFNQSALCPKMYKMENKKNADSNPQDVLRSFTRLNKIPDIFRVVEGYAFCSLLKSVKTFMSEGA